MKTETKMRMIQAPYTAYIAEDGIEFPTEEQCLAYEAKVLKNCAAIVKSLEQWELDIPFAGWDMEPDLQVMYMLRNKNEYEALEEYYQNEYGVDYWYGDAPESYPTAYIVLGRECYANGWELTGKMTEGWRELYTLTKAVHEKIINEVVEAYNIP